MPDRNQFNFLSFLDDIKKELGKLFDGVDYGIYPGLRVVFTVKSKGVNYSSEIDLTEIDNAAMSGLITMEELKTNYLKEIAGSVFDDKEPL